MSRVLMLVINPMTNDTRVEKEARSLVEAGYSVTIVATAAEGLARREERDGYLIVRVPYRRVVKEAVIAPTKRAATRASVRREADRASRATGRSFSGPLSFVAHQPARLLARLWLLTGGTLLKVIRSRILTLEYWLSIARGLPTLLERPDVIHAHDLGPLAAAVRLADAWEVEGTRPRVVYDSHELYTEQQTKWTRRERWAWMMHERRWIRRADAVLTVSPGIAAELRRRYRLPVAPTLIMNSPSVKSLEHESPSDVRSDAGCGDALLAVYVGAVKPGRGVDRLIPALAARDGWALAVVGGGNGAHVEALKEAAATAGVADRLHMLASVPAQGLPTYIRTADVGVHPMERTCLNHELALPNKLFDYLFAGLPVAVADLSEMKALVETNGLGKTFDPAEPEQVARSITETTTIVRPSAGMEKLEEWSWESQQARLLRTYTALIGLPCGDRNDESSPLG